MVEFHRFWQVVPYFWYSTINQMPYAKKNLSAFNRIYSKFPRRRNRNRRFKGRYSGRRSIVARPLPGQVVPNEEHVILHATYQITQTITIGLLSNLQSLLPVNLNNWVTNAGGENTVNGWDSLQTLYQFYYVKGASIEATVVNRSATNNNVVDVCMAPVTALFATATGFESLMCQQGAQYQQLTENTTSLSTLGSMGRMYTYANSLTILGLTKDQARTQLVCSTSTTNNPSVGWYLQYGSRSPSIETSTVDCLWTFRVKFYVCMYNPINQIVGSTA